MRRPDHRSIGLDAVNSGTKRVRPLLVRRQRAARPRIAPEIERAILQFALKDPVAGQDRVARELRTKKMFVSASGVRYVWQRHNLETLEKRVASIERNLAATSQSWTSTQLAARERIRTDRNSRRIAAKVMGAASTEFSRGDYILAIAAQLFREQGYDATSLRDIAGRAGIPVGSLYYHFPSKEDLFESVYEEGIRRLTGLVETAVSRADGPMDRLQAACAAHLRPMCDGDEFTTAAIPTRMPNVSEPVRKSIVALNTKYESIFRRLIEDLPLPPELNPSILRLQILGALNWTVTWYKLGKATPDEIASNLINALRLPLSTEG
jgi:AcrR family transcriptional regulator